MTGLIVVAVIIVLVVAALEIRKRFADPFFMEGEKIFREYAVSKGWNYLKSSDSRYYEFRRKFENFSFHSVIVKENDGKRFFLGDISDRGNRGVVLFVKFPPEKAVPLGVHFYRKSAEGQGLSPQQIVIENPAGEITDLIRVTPCVEYGQRTINIPEEYQAYFCRTFAALDDVLGSRLDEISFYRTDIVMRLEKEKNANVTTADLDFLSLSGNELLHL